MVIDKTTGRGCAWSITSKTITRKLAAEGIAGQTIGKKPSRRGDMFMRVAACGSGQLCVVPREGRGLPEGPLWVPSFIDAEIWKRAVPTFQPGQKLDWNVECFLLPKMEEFLENLTDAELVSITRDFLMEHGVLCTPICQRAGKTYYFNEREIFALDKRLFPHEGRAKFALFRIRQETCFNMNVWRKAASRFEVGMTLEECIGIFLKTGLIHDAPRELSPVDRLVQYIAPPIYERDPENRDKAVFDRIRVTVGLPRYRFHSWEALRNEVKTYQGEICQQVLRKLEQDRLFKRYGVPLNFLRLSHVMLMRDFSMEFIFELKEWREG